MMSWCRQSHKVRSNPVKQVPFETLYQPMSRTDDHIRTAASREGGRHVETRGKAIPHAKGSEDGSSPHENPFFVGSSSSSGSTVISSILPRGQRQTSAGDAPRGSAGSVGSAGGSAPRAVGASKSLDIEDFTPFSGTTRAEHPHIGYDLFDWTDDDLVLSTQAPPALASPFSREDTPRVFLLDPTSAANPSTSMSSSEGVSPPNEESRSPADVSPSRPVPRRSVIGVSSSELINRDASNRKH